MPVIYFSLYIMNRKWLIISRFKIHITVTSEVPIVFVFVLLKLYNFFKTSLQNHARSNAAENN